VSDDAQALREFAEAWCATRPGWSVRDVGPTPDGAGVALVYERGDGFGACIVERFSSKAIACGAVSAVFDMGADDVEGRERS
jgi:hypothetical protein